jgi:hypothetical protein
VFISFHFQELPIILAKIKKLKKKKKKNASYIL